MSVDAKSKLPKFLGERHLTQWLTNSVDGLKVLAEANVKWLETESGRAFVEKVRNAEEWLRSTAEGRRMVAEATKETDGRPRVLVVLYGNNEVQVFAEKNASIKLVNVRGDPSSKELTEKDVGIGWYDLVRWPNPEPPTVKRLGRVLSDLEQACIQQAADAYAALDRVLGLAE